MSRKRTNADILYGTYLVRFRRLRAAVRNNDGHEIRAAVLEVPRLQSSELMLALMAIHDVTTGGRRRTRDRFVRASP